MGSEFNRTDGYTDFVGLTIEPWAAFSHLVNAVQEIIESAGYQQKLRLTAEFEGGEHRESTVQTLMAAMRPTDLDGLRSLSININVELMHRIAVHVYMPVRWRKHPCFNYAIVSESEQLADAWDARLKREICYINDHPEDFGVTFDDDGVPDLAVLFEKALNTEGPPSPAPVVAPKPDPTPALVSLESKGLIEKVNRPAEREPDPIPRDEHPVRDWITNMSASAIGGVMTVVILAVAALLWSLLK